MRGQSEAGGPPVKKARETSRLVLIDEHGILRALFARVVHRTLDSAGLRALVATLSQHIRKEERQLFEGLQKRLSPEQMTALGKGLEQALADVSNACILPNEATRLRPKS